MYRIAVISSNQEYLDNAARFLSNFNSEFVVITIDDYTKINDILVDNPIDVYICDHDPPALDARTVFNKRLSNNDFRPFMVASRNSDKNTVISAFELGVNLWVPLDESYAVSFMRVSTKVVPLAESYRAQQNNRMNDRRLRSLVELSRMYDKNMDELMSYALEKSIELTNSDIGYLALYHKETDQLEMKIWSQHSLDLCRVMNRTVIYDLSKSGLWGEPVRRQIPMVINDYNSDAVPRKGTPAGHIPLKRLMMIPLTDRGVVIGTAGVGNKLDTYTEADLNQFILMMDGLTRIIVQRRQREENLAVQQRLRNVLMRSPMGFIMLDGDFNVTDCSDYAKNILDLDSDFTGGPLPLKNWIGVATLRMLENVRDYGDSNYSDTVTSGDVSDNRKFRIRVFSDVTGPGPFYFVSLEDYTTIASMSSTIEKGILMKKTFVDDLTSAIRSNIKSIGNMAKGISDPHDRDFILNMLSKMEPMARTIKELGDVGIIEPEWINVSDAFSMARTNYSGKFDYSVKTDGLIILADYTFYRVFMHLFDDGMVRGGLSKVDVSYRIADGALRIIYEDDAAGIPNELKASLFSSDPLGNGSDYFIINGIVTASGFTIEETGDPRKGTRFEIIVPMDRFGII